MYDVRVAAQRMAGLYADVLRERRVPSARIRPAPSLPASH
jgi:hypothetical protein